MVNTKRAVKTTTAERKAKAEALVKLRKEPKFLPAPAKSSLPKPTMTKPEPHKINADMVKKVNRKISKGRGKGGGRTKETFWMREGGILKYQNAPATKTGVFNQTNNIGSYARKNINPNTLPYTPIVNVDPLAGQINAEHGYEQGYLDFLNTMSEEQFQKYKPEIDTYTQGQGSGYKIGSLKDLQRLGQDKQYGPMHNWLMNEYTRLKSLRVPDMAPMASKTAMPAVKLNPAFEPTKATAPVAQGTIGIQQKPGVWDKIKGYINPTSVSNALMYANTYATNVGIGNDQRKAIADSLYQLPYMAHQYIRTGTPYTLAAQKQAAEVNSQGKRMAASTSDLNQGNVLRLQALKQASGLIEKGQGLDYERLDKLRNVQLESDTKVNQYNTGILGKNRGLTADAFKNIHLVNANQRNAQNANFTNLMLAMNQNLPVEEAKRNQKFMYEAMKNPKVKEAADVYTKILNEGKTN